MIKFRLKKLLHKEITHKENIKLEITVRLMIHRLVKQDINYYYNYIKVNNNYMKYTNFYPRPHFSLRINIKV